MFNANYGKKIAPITNTIRKIKLSAWLLKIRERKDNTAPTTTTAKRYFPISASNFFIYFSFLSGAITAITRFFSSIKSSILICIGSSSHKGSLKSKSFTNQNAAWQTLSKPFRISKYLLGQYPCLTVNSLSISSNISEAIRFSLLHLIPPGRQALATRARIQVFIYVPIRACKYSYLGSTESCVNSYCRPRNSSIILHKRIPYV